MILRGAGRAGSASPPAGASGIPWCLALGRRAKPRVKDGLLVLLLGEAGVAERHRGYLADLLPATTTADLDHQRTAGGLSVEKLGAEARSVARRLVAAYTATRRTPRRLGAR